MSRLLVLGAAPLPTEPQRLQYASNLRTWHFAKPLVDDGHEVLLAAGRIPGSYEEGTAARTDQQQYGLRYVSLDQGLFHQRATLQELHDEWQPDAIVGVNTYPSSRAVALDSDRPIWCDLNGWAMAEAQTKCHAENDDIYLSHFWKMERSILDRADVLSTVSLAQAHATVGELVARGRLGKRTFGYEFVHAIPNACSEVEYRHQRTVVRGTVVPEDAFVVFWLGGYNTWTDVDLIFHGLRRAMEENDSVHYVSTGGALDGHHEGSFARLVELIRASPLEERFHFVGWVPTEDVANYFFESDLGISVDSYNFETVFGARNRLNDMLKVGLPVLTTEGTEISHVIREHELGLTAPIGDHAAFAERISWAVRHREELLAIGRRGQEYGLREYSYARTTEPLRAWARDPERAPDQGERVVYRDVDFFRADPISAAPPESDASSQQRISELEQYIESIHGSKMWRLWNMYHRARRMLRLR